jgi:16S rRNA processing protein RimM
LSRAPDDLFAVGKIVKAFGVRGEFVVQPMTDEPERFRRLTTAYLVCAKDAEAQVYDAAQPVTVEHVHVQPRGVRVRLAGVDDRTSAEQIVGMLLMVDAQHRIRLPKDTFFVHDLIGMAVEADNGDMVGTLREVLHMPAHDVYVIENRGQEVMIPAVKEFILSIDVSSRRMRVKLIEGMRE